MTDQLHREAKTEESRRVSVQMQDQDDRTWITLGDAARILDIGEETVRGYLSQGKFQRTGKGRGTRVLLGDVRDYARRRNPAKRIAGKLAGKALVESRRKPRTIKPVEPLPASLEEGMFERALRARSDLVDLEDRLIILLTRKAELEEVVRAVETIERFARLTPEDSDVESV